MLVPGECDENRANRARSRLRLRGRIGIPTTAHKFAKAGTFTISEIITDALGDKSKMITFTETVTA